MASSISAAVAALESRAAAALTGVQQVAGQVGTYVAPEQFTVGDVTGADRPATLMGGAPQSFAESYDISCQVRSFVGGDDVKARRARALAMKDAIRDALAADMSMGGVVNQAYLATYTVRTGFDGSGEGVTAEVDLTVHVDNLQA